jgi:hypothetical protein
MLSTACMQVLLWTFCLCSSLGPASKAEFIDSHNYLLREKVGLCYSATARGGAMVGHGLGWRFQRLAGIDLLVTFVIAGQPRLCSQLCPHNILHRV